jgi:hypothetical protein
MPSSPLTELLKLPAGDRADLAMALWKASPRPKGGRPGVECRASRGTRPSLGGTRRAPRFCDPLA